MSVAGGLHRAIDRIRVVKGTALQIFTRNQRQWNAEPIRDEESADFRQAWKNWGNYPVAVHNSYLINLASPDRKLGMRSVSAFSAELDRTEKLGIPFLIAHPGAHVGSGIKKGLSLLVRRLDRAIDRADGENVTVLLETTAGQGTVLGGRFEELAEMIARSRHSDRLGICLDTCHVFSAGYDFRTPEGFEKTIADLDSTVGLNRLKFLHLNDSKNELASHKDRHEHIGKGFLGHNAFQYILHDSRLRELPMVLETPKDETLKDDKRNLRVLRRLAKTRPKSE